MNIWDKINADQQHWKQKQILHNHSQTDDSSVFQVISDVKTFHFYMLDKKHI